MSKVSELVEKVTKIMAAIFLLILTFNVFFQVLSRHFIKHPMVWTEEVARFSFIWCAFLGASLAVKNKAHFAVKVLTEKIPSFKKGLSVFSYICMLFVAGVFLIQGIKYSIMGIDRLSPTVNMQMVWIYSAIPVSAFFMIIYLVEQLLYEFRPSVEEGRD